jgi:hypothetical protein
MAGLVWRPPTLAVVLVVLGGIAWVVAVGVFSVQIALCFPSCGPVVTAGGSGGYPSGAVTALAWLDLYSYPYVVTLGLLTVGIGLKASDPGSDGVGTPCSRYPWRVSLRASWTS